MSKMSDFEKLKKALLIAGQLYEDNDFPAIQSSVFYHQKPPFQFVWKRPKEICPNPVFISENFVNCKDVVPGKLGDLWFTSIIGCLSTTKALFYRVVPADQSFDDDDYVGMFRFRIWWNGEWQEVIVDDKLPTVNNKLIFNHSINGNQFWTSLLEKAYCKLHGSYEALKYGNSLDGLADLTGGVSESISIKDSTDLYDVLSNLLTMTSINTAMVQNNKISKSQNNNCDRLPNGIVFNINYRVIRVDKVKTIDDDFVQLVKLRNPIGVSSDFIGSYKKEAIEWNKLLEEERERINFKQLIEGEFWMSFQEFIKTFTILEVVHLDAETSKDEPTFYGLTPWHMRLLRGSWRKGVTAGGCRNNTDTFHINPQIQANVSESDEIIICLNQHSLVDTKVIGFTIYDYSSNNFNEKLDKSFFKRKKSLFTSAYSNSKSIVLKVFLQMGTLIILPTTYESGQEGQFSLRIYSRKAVKLKPIDCNSIVLKPAIIKAPESFDQKFIQYETLFLRLSDEHKTINAFELQELLETCLPNDYVKSCATLEVCRQIVSCFDVHGNGRLKFIDYKNIMCSLRNWQNTFKNHTKGTTGILRAEKLFDALNEIGFQLSSEVLTHLVLRYMRKDGTLRFGDFVSCILHLIIAFNLFERKDPLQNGYIKLNISEFLKVSLS